MPQASENQRAKWGTNGGAGEEKATAFLYSKGYKQSKHWLWYAPNEKALNGLEAFYAIVVEDEKYPEGMEEYRDIAEAVGFLIDEWDMGGVFGYINEDGSATHFNVADDSKTRIIPKSHIQQSYTMPEILEDPNADGMAHMEKF